MIALNTTATYKGVTVLGSKGKSKDFPVAFPSESEAAKHLPNADYTVYKLDKAAYFIGKAGQA